MFFDIVYPSPSQPVTAGRGLVHPFAGTDRQTHKREHHRCNIAF